MFAVVRLVIFFAFVQSVSSLLCYQSMRDANNTIIIGIKNSSTVMCTRTVCACTSYLFECMNNDTWCSAALLQNHSIIWEYVSTDNDTCMDNMQDSSFINLTCCYTDLCNTEGLKITSTTVIAVNSTSAITIGISTTSMDITTINTTSTMTCDIITTSSKNLTSILSSSILIILLEFSIVLFVL